MLLQIEWIEEGLRVANISSVARALSNATQPEELTSKWIVLAIQALGRLLNITNACKDSKEETQQFIEVFIFALKKLRNIDWVTGMVCVTFRLAIDLGFQFQVDLQCVI